MRGNCGLWHTSLRFGVNAGQVSLAIHLSAASCIMHVQHTAQELRCFGVSIKTAMPSVHGASVPGCIYWRIYTIAAAASNGVCIPSCWQCHGNAGRDSLQCSMPCTAGVGEASS